MASSLPHIVPTWASWLSACHQLLDETRQQHHVRIQTPTPTPRAARHGLILRGRKPNVCIIIGHPDAMLVRASIPRVPSMEALSTTTTSRGE